MTPPRTSKHHGDDVVARLVADAVSGDEAAFATLADRYRPVVHAHCRRLLRSAHDAEDAVQETLLRAWRRRDRFEGRSSFGWWLQRIATNACMDIGRCRARPGAAVSPLGDEGVDAATRTEEAETDPAALVATREAVEDAYLVAIRVLPARQRSVLVLRDVLRFSAADTAALLGDSVASVNSALQRARAGLDRQRRISPRPTPPATPAERELVRRVVEAHGCADPAALAQLLA